MNDATDPSPKVRGRWVLLIAVVIAVVLPRIPFVAWVQLPLGWLGTLAHETGHALAALAVGGEVSGIEVFLNGSGVTHSSYTRYVPWYLAITAVAGLVGPAVVSAGLLWASLGPRLVRVCVGLLGAALWVEAFTLTQGFATMIALSWGTIALLAAWKLPGRLLRLGTLVVAVQLALQVYRGSGYLFVAEAQTGAGALASDVANLASSLGGHYLLWGVGVGLLDLLLLGVGLLGFFFGERWLSR